MSRLKVGDLVRIDMDKHPWNPELKNVIGIIEECIINTRYPYIVNYLGLDTQGLYSEKELIKIDCELAKALYL